MLTETCRNGALEGCGGVGTPNWWRQTGVGRWKLGSGVDERPGPGVGRLEGVVCYGIARGTSDLGVFTGRQSGCGGSWPWVGAVVGGWGREICAVAGDNGGELGGSQKREPSPERAGR